MWYGTDSLLTDSLQKKTEIFIDNICDSIGYIAFNRTEAGNISVSSEY